MRPYIKLLILLISALVIMGLLSELDDIRIFGHDLATMHNPVADEEIRHIGGIDSTTAIMVATEEPAIQDTIPCTMLMIGDSMVEGLSRRLGAYASYNGHKLYAVIWYGSTTEKWAESKRLSEYAGQYNPDYIIICLGGNELFVKDISTKRRKFVKEIISEASGVPYIWIGPPNWKKDTGINGLISSEAGNKFFLSENLRFERASDGRHPTYESSCEWMDSVVAWMKRTMPHPKLDVPEKKTEKPYKTIVLTPDD